jgi:hypothetical protein
MCMQKYTRQQVVAWAHIGNGRCDVIADEVKQFLLRAKPELVEFYAIPLKESCGCVPMSTEQVCKLIQDVLGVSYREDGNMVKLVRAVEAMCMNNEGGR